MDAPPPAGRAAALLDATPVGIVAIDAGGRCTFANDAAVAMLGQPAAHLHGHDLHATIHHHYADGSPYPREHCPILSALHTATATRIADDVVWRANGQPIPVEYAVNPLPDAAGGAVIAMLDIAARRQAEAERDRLLGREQAARIAAEIAQTRLTFLARAGATLAAAQDDDEALRRLAALAVPALGDSCIIELTGADGRSRRVAAQPPDATVPAGPNDTTTAAPLLARGRALGTLTVHRSGSRYEPDDVAQVEEVARLAALIIDNARLAREAREAEERMQALAGASHAFAEAALDERRLLDTVARRAAAAGDACIIRLLSADGRSLRPVAVFHPQPAVVTALRRRLRGEREDDGVNSQVLRTGRPVLAAELPPAAPVPTTGFVPAGLICVPLRAGGRVLGTLTTLRDSGRPPYTTDDLAFLEDLAGRAALAVAQSHAYAGEQSARREAERARETERFLAEASILLSSSLEYDTTLRRLVALAVPRLADWCLVHLLDAQDQVALAELACASPDKRAILESFRSHPFALEAPDNPTAEAIRTGRPQLIPEVPESWAAAAAGSEEAAARLRALDARSFIVAPLMARGRTIGALTLVTSESGRRFGARDLVVTTGLARRASTAIENARLYRESEAAANEARQHAERIERLAQAARRFAEAALDRERLLSTVTRELSAVTGDPCVMEIRPEDGEPEAVAYHTDREAAARLRTVLTAIGGPGAAPLTQRALATGGPVVRGGGAAESVTDSIHPALRPFAAERQVHSLLVVPLMVRGRPLGTLSTWREGAAPPYVPADIPFIEDVATRAALAIDNALRYTAEGHARRQAEAATRRAARLQEVTAALSAPLTPAQAAGIVVRAAREALGADAGSVQMLTASGAELEVIAAEGYAPTLVQQWQRYPISRTSLAATAVRTGEPVWLPSIQAALEQFPMLATTRAAGADGALAAVPLRYEHRLIGALGLSFTTPRLFPAEERAFVEALAGQCAQALERARLHEGERRALAEAERERARFALLAEVSATLAGSLDYAVTLTRVAQFAVAGFASYCIIDVLDEHGSPQRLAAVHHDATKTEIMARLRDYPPPLEGENIAARVLRSGVPALEAAVTPAFLERGVRGPAHAALVAALSPRSVVAAPLVARGRRVGVITFVRTAAAPPYTAADVTLAEEIGRRAAIAIDTARLFQFERTARAEAEAANLAKDEFLSVLSHELRTPLTSILGWARILRSRRLDAATVDTALATIESSARTQSQLVEDILDVSRIVTGRLRLEPSTVDPAEILQAAAATVQPTAQAKGVTLTVDAPAALAILHADADRLQQVVWNLLSNAVKFTQAGGTVALALRREDGHIAITVTDTGAGIAPEFLPYVFDRFRQADASSTRAYGGLGLGLSIVRHLTELHGGTAHAESGGPGKGARFTVRLPVAAETPAPSSPPSAAAPSAALSGRRLLLVEDDAPGRAVLCLTLQEAGAQVTAAASAEEGFDAFVAAPPDVLISDIAMPGEDGYGLIGRVRAWEAVRGQKPTPALALTAYAGGAARERALKAGFDAYLAKPASPEALRGAVAALLPK